MLSSLRSVLARPRTVLVTGAVCAFSMGLVVACVGGSGSLGEFGEDGVASSSVQTTGSSGASSSGRTGSSTSTSTSSGISSTSSGATSSSGTTTSSSGSTTSSGGSSGSTSFACGTTTCSSTTQYCVKPCCDLTQQSCFAQDGGSCPTGYSFGFCTSAGANGCVLNCTSSQTNPYCTTSQSTAGLDGTCSFSSATRTINCTCN